MATTTTKQAVPRSRAAAAGGHRRPGAPPQRPYSVREAAALLGVSPDAIVGNYRDLEGFRVGRRILIPRRVVDRLTGAPGGAARVSDRAPGGDFPAPFERRGAPPTAPHRAPAPLRRPPRRTGPTSAPKTPPPIAAACNCAPGRGVFYNLLDT